MNEVCRKHDKRVKRIVPTRAKSATLSKAGNPGRDLDAGKRCGERVVAHLEKRCRQGSAGVRALPAA